MLSSTAPEETGLNSGARFNVIFGIRTFRPSVTAQKNGSLFAVTCALFEALNNNFFFFF